MSESIGGAMKGVSAGSGEASALPESSPLPPYMRSTSFDGQKRWLQLRRPGDNENRDKLPTNPFYVANEIERQLKRGSLRKSVTLSLENGGQSYAISTFNLGLVEDLKKITRLDSNTAVEVIDHPFLSRIQGIVFQQDTIDMTEVELLAELKTQGVIAVKRITKFVDKKVIKTPLTILTFASTCLPKAIYFGWTRVPVRTFYESPMICKNCLQYRHTKKRCKEERRCIRCSGSHEFKEDESCKLPFKCPHCPEGDNDHSAVGRNCPKYRLEEAVIRVRTDESLSWTEARKRIETQLHTSKKPVYARDLQ